jgi:hypothetical protein
MAPIATFGAVLISFFLQEPGGEAFEMASRNLLTDALSYSIIHMTATSFKEYGQNL